MMTLDELVAAQRQDLIALAQLDVEVHVRKARLRRAILDREHEIARLVSANQAQELSEARKRMLDLKATVTNNPEEPQAHDHE